MNKASISDYYRAIVDHVSNQILTSSDDLIIKTDTEELVEKFYSTNHFEPIVVDTSKDESFSHKKEMRNVPADRREDFYRQMGDKEFEYESIVIKVPLVKNSDIYEIVKLRPSTFSLSWTPDHASWTENEAKISVDIKGYGFNKDEQKIKTDVDFEKSRLYEYINWVSSDIRKENESLQNTIRRLVGERKNKLDSDKEMASNLSNILGISEEKESLSENKQSLEKDENLVVSEDSHYDVFISYASEDIDFAKKLADKLRDSDIKVWFDGFEVKWGNDLRSIIDNGLKKTKFGIVIFSRSYLAKKRWTEYELNGLFAKEKKENIILPIWHEIEREEMFKYSPSLADRVAKKSDNIDEIVIEIKNILNG
jgi:hypothetical protein